MLSHQLLGELGREKPLVPRQPHRRTTWLAVATAPSAHLQTPLPHLESHLWGLELIPPRPVEQGEAAKSKAGSGSCLADKLFLIWYQG